MVLAGERLYQIHGALLQGFPDRGKLNELTTFHLSVNLDEIVGPGNLSYVIFELIRWANSQGRLEDLVRAAIKENPKNPYIGDLRTTADAVEARAQSVRDGLTALKELLADPAARGAAIRFGADFEAADEQLTVLGDCKALHDVLHDLQVDFYDPAILHLRVFTEFPNEVTADILRTHGRYLQNGIEQLGTMGERATRAGVDLAWVRRDLLPAYEQFQLGLAGLDPGPLKEAVAKLNRILSRHPSRVNDRLIAVAKNLRLPKLVSGLTEVRDALGGLKMDPRKLQVFDDGVMGLAGLSQTLGVRVAEHDTWQELDVSLRSLAPDPLDPDTTRYERTIRAAWGPSNDLVLALCGERPDKWATELAALRRGLEDAVARDHPGEVAKSFKTLRDRAVEQFYYHDKDLITLLERLRTIGRPLDAVLEIIS